MIWQIIVTAGVSATVSAVVTAIVGAIKSKHSNVMTSVNAISNGLLACLRNDIIKDYDKYTKKGYCPIYAKDAVEKSYKAYHELGGNGTITKLYEELMALPTEPKGV